MSYNAFATPSSGNIPQSASSHTSSLATPLPVHMVDEAFHHSGREIRVQLVRTWPVTSSSSSSSSAAAAAASSSPSSAASSAASSSLRVLRTEVMDVDRNGAYPHPPIEVFFHGEWAEYLLNIAKYDVLTIRNPLVRPTTGDMDALDHAFKLVIDESEGCESTEVKWSGWKERVLKREGELITLAILRQKKQQQQQQEEEEKAAADKEAADAAAEATAEPGAAENPIDADVASSEPQQKKRKVTRTTASASEFQAASALIAEKLKAPPEAAAAASSTPAAPKPPLKPKRKLRGCDIHGAYVYTPLSEFKNRPKEKLNFYAIVLQARGPKATHGSDLVLSLTCTDLSLSTADSVSFNIFRRSISALPAEGTIQRGDIIRIHRAEMSEFQGNILGVLPEKSSSFILLRGASAIGNSMEPYFKPNDSYSEVDQDIVKELRNYTQSQLQHRLNAPLPAMNDFEHKYLRTLSKLENRGFYDFILALIFVDQTGNALQQQQKEYAESQNPPLLMPPTSALAYVWDGTDVSKQLRLQRVNAPNHVQLPHSTFVCPGFTNSAASNNGGAQQKNTNQKYFTPRLGSVVPVAYYTSPTACFSSYIPAPDMAGFPSRNNAPVWIQLRNIPFEILNGLFYWKFTTKSKISLLDPNDNRVKSLMAQYEARLQREVVAVERIQPYVSCTPPGLLCVSNISRFQLPITPVKLLQLSMPDGNQRSNDGGLVGKYRIRARVIATCPDAFPNSSNSTSEGQAAPMPLEQICKLRCSRCNVWGSCSNSAGVSDVCSVCQRSDQLSYGYFLKLIVQDTTGMIPVLVCGKEADELFQGLPADNLYSSRTTLKFVQQRLWKLLEAGSFIDAHIHAYQVSIQPPDGGNNEDDAAMDMSQEFHASQIGSQELQAFFAPHIPQIHGDDDMDLEGKKQMPPQIRQVFRLVDCSFRSSIQ